MRVATPSCFVFMGTNPIHLLAPQRDINKTTKLCYAICSPLSQPPPATLNIVHCMALNNVNPPHILNKTAKALRDNDDACEVDDERVVEPLGGCRPDATCPSSSS